MTHHTPKIALLATSLLMMCVIDTVCTRWEMGWFSSVEGNPLMQAMITHFGWGMVWAIKLGSVLVLCLTAKALYRSCFGKGLVWSAIGAYAIVCIGHLIIYLNV